MLETMLAVVCVVLIAAGIAGIWYATPVWEAREDTDGRGSRSSIGVV